MTKLRADWLTTAPRSISDTKERRDFLRNADNWNFLVPPCENDHFEGGHMWRRRGTGNAAPKYFGRRVKLDIVWYVCVTCRRVRISVHPSADNPPDDDCARFYTGGALP